MHDDATRAAEELRFDVKQALRTARPLFPAGRGRGDDDDTLSLIAKTVVEHLTRCRWRFDRLPPPPATRHGHPGDRRGPGQFGKRP